MLSRLGLCFVLIAVATAVGASGGGESGDVVFTLTVHMDFSHHGAVTPINWGPDGQAKVDIRSGEDPTEAVERFSAYHDLTGAQTQYILDALCGTYPCPPNSTSILLARTFLLDQDALGPASKDRPAYVSRSEGRSADFVPLEVVPARTVPEGMTLTRAHLIEGLELFVVDDVVSPQIRRRWYSEMRTMPMARSMQDAPGAMMDLYYPTADTKMRAAKAWGAELDPEKVQRLRHPIYVQVARLMEALFPGERLTLIRVDAHRSKC